MMRVLAIFLALVCSFSGSTQAEEDSVFGDPRVRESIQFRRLDDVILIDTLPPRHYVVTSPKLEQNDIKTVSINGDKVEIVRPSCERITKEVNALTQLERRLIDEAKDEIYKIKDLDRKDQFKKIRAYMTYSLHGAQYKKRAKGFRVSSYSGNGLFGDYFLFENEGFKVSKNSGGILPEKSAMIFSIEDTVTYVSNDGQVQMEPVKCLSDTKREQFDQLKADVEQAYEAHERQIKAEAGQMSMEMSKDMDEKMADFQVYGLPKVPKPMFR